MGLLPVYVRDVPWVSFKDRIEKFSHMLNDSESDLFLKKLFSVSITELEAKKRMVLHVRDNHFSFLGVVCEIEGFMVHHDTPDLKCEKDYGGFSCELGSASS